MKTEYLHGKRRRKNAARKRDYKLVLKNKRNTQGDITPSTKEECYPECKDRNTQKNGVAGDAREAKPGKICKRSIGSR